MGRAFRRAGLVAALTLCALLPAAGSASAKPKRTTISFIAAIYSPDTTTYWKRTIARFEQLNPDVRVRLEVTRWKDINTRIISLLSAGREPDILNLDSYSNFAGDGLLLPASKVLSPSTRRDFVPIFARNGQYEGVQYGIPIAGSVRGLFFNKTLFRKAGIRRPPRTWAELERAARLIKKRTGAIGYGMPLGREEAQAEYSLFMWGNGGDWFRKGKWVIDNPRNREALAFMDKLANVSKVTQPNPGRTNRTDLWWEFRKGGVGMIMGSNFFATQLKVDRVPLDYGTAQVPSSNGKYRFTLGVEDYLLVFKSTKHPDEVRRFLDFIYSTDMYAEFIRVHGFLPVTKSVSRQVAADDPIQRVFITIAPTARFYPTSNPVWGAIAPRVKTTLGKALERELTPRQVLAQLQRAALEESRRLERSR